MNVSDSDISDSDASLFRESILDIDEAPERYICPISREVMKRPSQTIYGQIYESTCIMPWILKHGTCPITRQPLNKDV